MRGNLSNRVRVPYLFHLIIPRDLKPHNILLAAKDRKGPGLGRRVGGTQQAEGGGGEGKEDGEGALVAPRKLSNMRDLAKFVLKISDMGLGKQLLNGQSRCGWAQQLLLSVGKRNDQIGVRYRVSVHLCVTR